MPTTDRARPAGSGDPRTASVVLDFVNTRAVTRAAPTAREDLDGPGALDDWARRHLGVVEERSSGPDDLTDALAVREGLRALLARHNDAAAPGDGDAVAALDAVADRVGLRASPTADEPLVAAPGGPGRGVVAALLVRVVLVRVGGQWPRMKVCRDPHCREAFYDGSKNRSRSWCSMAVCGARSKQRAMTARRRGT